LRINWGAVALATVSPYVKLSIPLRINKIYPRYFNSSGKGKLSIPLRINTYQAGYYSWTYQELSIPLRINLVSDSFNNLITLCLLSIPLRINQQFFNDVADVSALVFQFHWGLTSVWEDWSTARRIKNFQFHWGLTFLKTWMKFSVPHILSIPLRINVILSRRNHVAVQTFNSIED